MLWFDVQDALEPMQIGESGKVRIGQQVLAIGNPFGFDHTLTTGQLAPAPLDCLPLVLHLHQGVPFTFLHKFVVLHMRLCDTPHLAGCCTVGSC